MLPTLPSLRSVISSLVFVRFTADKQVMKTAWDAAKKGEKKAVYIHGFVSRPWRYIKQFANVQVYNLGTGQLEDLGISQGPDGPLSPKEA